MVLTRCSSKFPGNDWVLGHDSEKKKLSDCREKWMHAFPESLVSSLIHIRLPITVTQTPTLSMNNKINGVQLLFFQEQMKTKHAEKEFALFGNVSYSKE